MLILDRERSSRPCLLLAHARSAIEAANSGDHDPKPPEFQAAAALPCPLLPCSLPPVSSLISVSLLCCIRNSSARAHAASPERRPHLKLQQDPCPRSPPSRAPPWSQAPAPPVHSSRRPAAPVVPCLHACAAKSIASHLQLLAGVAAAAGNRRRRRPPSHG